MLQPPAVDGGTVEAMSVADARSQWHFYQSMKLCFANRMLNPVKPLFAAATCVFYSAFQPPIVKSHWNCYGKATGARSVDRSGVAAKSLRWKVFPDNSELQFFLDK